MRWLLLLCLLCVASYAYATESTGKPIVWYIAHINKDNCLPLAGIDDGGNRLYDNTGAIHTPEDYVAWWLRRGIKLQREDSPNIFIRYYHVIYPPDQDVTFVLFSDKKWCNYYMSKVDP